MGRTSIGKLYFLFRGRSTRPNATEWSRRVYRFAFCGFRITAAFDRHRGGGCPPTPATPPCVRVRTRRFELVALAPVDQRRKSQRVEVRRGEAPRAGLG